MHVYTLYESTLTTGSRINRIFLQTLRDTRKYIEIFVVVVVGIFKKQWFWSQQFATKTSSRTLKPLKIFVN